MPHRLSGSGQPLVSTVEADPSFCNMLSQRASVLEVLIDKPEQVFLCKPGIRMVMHGYVMPGWVGHAPQPLAASHLLVS
jgi:hypothetical protein